MRRLRMPPRHHSEYSNGKIFPWAALLWLTLSIASPLGYASLLVHLKDGQTLAASSVQFMGDVMVINNEGDRSILHKSKIDYIDATAPSVAATSREKVIPRKQTARQWKLFKHLSHYDNRTSTYGFSIDTDSIRLDWRVFCRRSDNDWIKVKVLSNSSGSYTGTPIATSSARGSKIIQGGFHGEVSLIIYTRSECEWDVDILELV